MIRFKTIACVLVLLLLSNVAIAGQNTTKQILATQPASLQAYYRCNDADGLFQDSSGNARHADNKVGTSFVYAARGKDGLCVTQSGGGSYEYRASSVLGAAPTTFTLMAWYNGTGTIDQSIISFGSSANNNPMIQVLQSSTQLSTLVRNAAGTFRLQKSSLGVINNGAWRHVALTFNGTSYVTYLDGTAVDTTAGTNDITLLDRTGIGVLVRASASGPVQGSIQHVAVWNVALNGTEIGNIYSAAKFTGPDIPALPGSPTARYFSDYGQFEYDSSNREITTWADSTGNGNNLVGGSANLSQSKPYAAFDPDGLSGVFFPNASSRGFEAPTTLSGNSQYGAVVFCCRNEFERNRSVSRLFNVAGLSYTITADGSTPSDNAPKFGSNLENRLPCTHSRNVIGYWVNGTSKKLFFDGMIYDVTGTDTNTSASGGYIGQRPLYSNEWCSGYLHDLAIWPATSSGGVVAYENWLAACNAEMTTWAVPNYSDQDFFIQCIGDSMSNGGDGSADYPSGWADKLRLPSIAGRYQVHMDGYPGARSSDIAAFMPEIIARKNLLNKKHNIALIIIGTNDVSATTSNTTTAVLGLQQLFKDNGYTVIGSTIPPQGGFSTSVPIINSVLRAATIANKTIDGERGLPLLFGPLVRPGANALYVDEKHPTTPPGYTLYTDWVSTQTDEDLQELFPSVSITAETIQKERRDDYQLIMELYVGETIQIARYINDTNGSPLDLSDKSLQFQVETKSKVPVASVDDITIFGDNSNGFRLTIPSAVTSLPRLLECSLRDVSNGNEVLARGQITVKYAPVVQ